MDVFRIIRATLTAALFVFCLPLGAQPRVTEDGETLFRLEGEYATQVYLDASWMDEPVLMQKSDGVWELRVKGLSSDLYSYSFIIDGHRTPDPSNPQQICDGLYRESWFTVDGPKASRYLEPSRRGSVDYVWYDSAVLGTTRRVAVYTPYGYSKNVKQRYPVLYLLHPEGGDEESWLSAGRLAEILDNLIAEGKAKPMIVVMPNADPTRQAAGHIGLPEVTNARTTSSMVFASSLVHEIVPFVDSRYRTLPSKASRAIGGIGENGEAILRAAVMYTGLFDYICPISCGLESSADLQKDLLRVKNGGVKLLWMGCGSKDEEVLPQARKVHEMMDEIHLFHTFYVNSGYSDWRSWRQYLSSFAPLIFKYYKD